MPNEGYRKRLEEWEETQKRMKEQAKEEPYEPAKMRSRAPWGCVALAIGFAIFVMHTLGALAGFWKNIFFKS
jgi:hypothetical protein